MIKPSQISVLRLSVFEHYVESSCKVAALHIRYRDESRSEAEAIVWQNDNIRGGRWSTWRARLAEDVLVWDTGAMFFNYDEAELDFDNRVLGRAGGSAVGRSAQDLDDVEETERI